MHLNAGRYPLSMASNEVGRLADQISDLQLSQAKATSKATTEVTSSGLPINQNSPVEQNRDQQTTTQPTPDQYHHGNNDQSPTIQDGEMKRYIPPHRRNTKTTAVSSSEVITQHSTSTRPPIFSISQPNNLRFLTMRRCKTC